MKKRFLAKIVSNEDYPVFDNIREIDNNTFEFIEKSINIVDEVNNNMDLFLILRNNYHEFLDLNKIHLGKIIDNIKDPLNIGNDNYTRLKIEINRSVLNYLSSFRMYIDHCDKKINKRFGKESSEYLNFKKILSKSYDENFEYKFIYKLRNFCQHCGLPVSDFNLDNYKGPITLGLNFNSEYLLNEYDSWTLTIKKDLERINGLFPVNEILSKHIEIIEIVSNKIHLLYENIFIESLNDINSFTKPFRNELELVILTKNPSPVGKYNITITKFPFDLIDKFINGIC